MYDRTFNYPLARALSHLSTDDLSEVISYLSRIKREVGTREIHEKYGSLSDHAVTDHFRRDAELEYDERYALFLQYRDSDIDCYKAPQKRIFFGNYYLSSILEWESELEGVATFSAYGCSGKDRVVTIFIDSYCISIEGMKRYIKENAPARLPRLK